MASREADDPRRRILVRALALGLLGAVPGAARAQPFNPPGKLPPGQSIHRITGEVTVNGQPADLKTSIKPGDTVKTSGKASEVIFVVGSQAMILRGASEVLIERPPEPNTSAFTRALRLARGALLSVSREMPMQVKTGTATVGIRGTGFYVEAQEDQTYFCTCYGVTDVASVKQPEKVETVSATRHDRPLYILAGGGGGPLIRNAPFINHTDQELALIEALVGREPPFVFPKDSYSAPRRGY
jgi:hypothetical protein